LQRKERKEKDKERDLFKILSNNNNKERNLWWERDKQSLSSLKSNNITNINNITTITLLYKWESYHICWFVRILQWKWNNNIETKWNKRSCSY
jgi:hypothetical protein